MTKYALQGIICNLLRFDEDKKLLVVVVTSN